MISQAKYKFLNVAEDGAASPKQVRPAYPHTAGVRMVSPFHSPISRPILDAFDSKLGLPIDLIRRQR
jgi:hypothetical protein